MSVNLNLIKTIKWTKPFLHNQPLGFSDQEPALTTGNMVLGTIISAPLKWPWNRGRFAFNTIVGVCDYTRSLPDFGFLEDQWVNDAGMVYPLTGAYSLPFATGTTSRPTAIAAQEEDGAGNVLFRTKEMPGKIYTVNGSYQRATPMLTSLATPLAPLPDKLAYVFNWGFLAVTSLLNNDPRAPVFEKFFIGRLLGLQGGLSDVDRNIFLNLWASNMKTMLNTQSDAQQANVGRSGS